MKKSKKLILIILCSVIAVIALSAAMVLVYKSGQSSIDPT